MKHLVPNQIDQPMPTTIRCHTWLQHVQRRPLALLSRHNTPLAIRYHNRNGRL